MAVLLPQLFMSAMMILVKQLGECQRCLTIPF